MNFSNDKKFTEIVRPVFIHWLENLAGGYLKVVDDDLKEKKGMTNRGIFVTYEPKIIPETLSFEVRDRITQDAFVGVEFGVVNPDSSTQVVAPRLYGSMFDDSHKILTNAIEAFKGMQDSYLLGETPLGAGVTIE